MSQRRLMQWAKEIRPHLFGLGALSLMTTTLIIAQMVYLSRIIHDVFMEGATGSSVARPLAILLGLIAARALLTFAHTFLAQQGAIRIKSTLRNAGYTRLLTDGPARLQEERTGELTATLTDGLEKIDTFYARYIPRALHVAIAPLVITGFVLSIDVLSGCILFFTGPLIPLFMFLIGSQAERRTRKQWTALSRMSAHFLDVVQGLTTLKLFGRTRAQEQEIRRVSNRYRVTTMGVLKIAFLSGLVLELAASLSTAIVAVQIGVRLVEGHIPFQLGLCVLLLAPEFYLPFRQLGVEHHAAMEGQAAAERLAEILDRPLPSASAHPIPPPPTPFSLKLTDVGYTYPDRSHPALQALHIHFEPNEITAIVGPSGAGKSTLFHLLTRQLDPDTGIIRAGDTDLQDMDRRAWRAQLAVVPQKPALFHGTVLDNLRLARDTAVREEIEVAARLAEAHDFILRLPQGYDTLLGEQAWRLSGGERQRLALARAFLKNAPILLMDEPSAHLDPESEERIATAFERLSRDRLVLIIAHRLRSVYRADRILVLQEGQRVEFGTHDELLAQQGPYAHMMGRG